MKTPDETKRVSQAKRRAVSTKSSEQSMRWERETLLYFDERKGPADQPFDSNLALPHGSILGRGSDWSVSQLA